MKKFLCALLFVLFTGTVFAQSTAPRSSNVIIQELRDNYKAVLDCNEELKSAVADKDITIEELREKVLTITAENDKAIEEKVKSDAENLKKELKIKRLAKGLAISTSILGGFLLLHILILILYYKFKITLPYTLNTIL
jgi:Skp family chaperone for outer membrane proteins